jgi:hypothetical protein
MYMAELYLTSINVGLARACVKSGTKFEKELFIPHKLKPETSSQPKKVRGKKLKLSQWNGCFRDMYIPSSHSCKFLFCDYSGYLCSESRGVLVESLTSAAFFVHLDRRYTAPVILVENCLYSHHLDFVKLSILPPGSGVRLEGHPDSSSAALSTTRLKTPNIRTDKLLSDEIQAQSS